MRVCGKDEIQQFIESCDQKSACDDAKSLLCELLNGDWKNLENFQNDYPNAIINEYPKVRFLLADNTIQLECITCFDLDVLLVVSFRKRDERRSDNQNRSDWEAA